MRDVIIFVEHTFGQARRVSLEIAGKARELAGSLGGRTHAVVLGSGAAALAESLRSQPIDVLHVAEDPDVDAFLVDPSVAYLEAVARAVGPALILVPNTMMGRDVGSRVAARLQAGITADVTDLVVREGRVACVSPKLGGLMITTCTFTNTEYGVAAVRPNVFPVRSESGGGETVLLPKPERRVDRMRIEETVREQSPELAVEEASTVVSGGLGVGGPEPFRTILKDLAESFGGAVGASRAAVDRGWIPHSHQVGQTGKTISPQLYIACGISGAIQHKVGMRTARTIIAINKDSNVAIGEFADLLVVGDLFAIVPELTKMVRAAKAA